MLANVLRVILLAVPLLASVGTVAVLGRVLPPGAARAWWGVALLFVVALVVGLVVERAARRLLPLAVLLKLTMVFPDRAPSRFRLARSAVRTSSDELLWTGTDATPTSTSAAVLSLLAALGAHDRKTRGHSERVRVLCDMLAEELKLDTASRDRLRWAALLHDVGKMEVSAGILNKPARLDSSEFDAVKRHPEAGARLVGPLLPWLGEWGLGIAEHHEKYDGTGYPAGLSGRDISDAGRLISVVDAFETMTATRSYKKAMATRAAREELARCAGAHFDPVYVRAFLAVSVPRLLWAMGPLSFFLQLPFLRSLAEAGARTSVATGQAAAGAANAAALATAGVAVAGAAVTGAAAPPAEAPLPRAVGQAVAPAPPPPPAPRTAVAPPAAAPVVPVPPAVAAPVAEPAPPAAPARVEPTRAPGQPRTGKQQPKDDKPRTAPDPDAEPEAEPEPGPVEQPAREPATPPGSQPTTVPTAPPTAGETAGEPVSEPTAQPTGAPSAAPTAPPSGEPTEPPAEQPPVLQPTITQAPPQEDASRDATFVVSHPAGTTLECQQARPSDAEPVWQACTSPVTYTGLANGVQRFRVRTVAAPGVYGTPTDWYAWTVNGPGSTQEQGSATPTATTSRAGGFQLLDALQGVVRRTHPLLDRADRVVRRADVRADVRAVTSSWLRSLLGR